MKRISDKFLVQCEMNSFRHTFRQFALLGIGLFILGLGLYALAQCDCDSNSSIIPVRFTLSIYVIAGAFGIAALVEKIWKE